MIKLIKRLIFAWRFRRAVKRADRLRHLTHRKHLVILLNGRPTTVAKQTIRRMIHAGDFKKGTRISDIERRALYVTL